MTMIETQPVTAPGEERSIYGVLAEFEDTESLLAAAERVRDAGYKRWEAYTPFPVHGLDKAMGHTPTVLPWIVLIAGLAGLAGGSFLMWYANATSFDVPHAIRGYEFIVSGKPTFSLPANIPPIFETTILLSATGAFVGMLALNLLPRFAHPVFRSRRFARATQDRFFIGIEATDAAFDRDGTAELLDTAGAVHIEELEQEA